VDIFATKMAPPWFFTTTRRISMDIVELWGFEFSCLMAEIFIRRIVIMCRQFQFSRVLYFDESPPWVASKLSAMVSGKERSLELRRLGGRKKIVCAER
jgi:hypothetical protein